MFESLIVLGKVGVVLACGFAVATGLEWFSDLEVSPKNKKVTVGKEKEQNNVTSKRNEHNTSQINNLQKKVRG